MDASDNPPDEAQALESLLRWYVAMGVDVPIGDAPLDRFLAPPPAAAPARPSGITAPPPPAAFPAAIAPRSADAQVAEAQELAAGAADLADLEARLAAVPGLGLAKSSRMIAAQVPQGAALILFGGAPGEDDERTGAIFAGKAGSLLDAMLRAIGLGRADVGLAHVVPWRPPGNRAATPLELALCLPFSRRLIEITGPHIIVCLGERAAQPLLGSKEPLSRLRGRWLDYEGEAAVVKTLATFAPGFLLGQPLQKRRAWADLLMLETELEALRRREP